MNTISSPNFDGRVPATTTEKLNDGTINDELNPSVSEAQPGDLNITIGSVVGAVTIQDSGVIGIDHKRLSWRSNKSPPLSLSLFSYCFVSFGNSYACYTPCANH